MIAVQTYSDADFFQSFVADPVFDLTGKFVRMMVRKHAEDATVYLDLTTYNAGIILIANTQNTTGVYVISILQSQLLNLPVGDYVFSVIVFESGAHTEIGRGTLTHSAGPTRW